jgi:hypothetical protein
MGEKGTGPGTHPMHFGSQAVQLRRRAALESGKRTLSDERVRADRAKRVMAGLPVDGYTTDAHEKNDIAHTFSQSDGGHSWFVRRRYLAEFLPLLFVAQG